MNKIVICKKIVKAVSSVIVGIMVLFAVLIAGIRIFGLDVYMVLSPSMEPNIKTGSLIYVDEVDPKELEVGDVITFRLVGDITATHRIDEIVPHEEADDVVRFRTKGDNNEQADGELVYAEDIIGTPILILPYLGYIVNFIQSPVGMVVCVCAALFLIIITMLFDTIFGNGEKNTDEDDTEDGGQKGGDGTDERSEDSSAGVKMGGNDPEAEVEK